MFSQKKLMILDLMGLIKNGAKPFYVWCLVLLFYLCVNPLFAQNRQIAAEITVIEKKLSDSKLSAAERINTLETLARIYELSGNIEYAADTWEKAGKAVSGNAGHADLLQSARCFAAIGEFEKADAVLRPVLAASGNRSLHNKARLLSAQTDALKTGNTAVLSGLLTNPDFAAEKPVLYYSLWKLSSDPAVQTAMASRLLAEFPNSPEARIIRDDSAVKAVPAALWLLTGNESTPAVIYSPPAAPAVSSQGNAVLLQTGYFGLEENAGNMANKLRIAGFSPVIEKKTVNGKDHWIVGVVSGQDYAGTMRQLKEKGFDSFPAY